MSIEPSRSRAWGIESPGVLPSEVSCLRPRTDWKGFRGAAWRVTRVSKKCLRAARAWFLVELSPGSSSMKRPARPGETWGSSRRSSSHQERNRLTTWAARLPWKFTVPFVVSLVLTLAGVVPTSIFWTKWTRYNHAADSSARRCRA